MAQPASAGGKVVPLGDHPRAKARLSPRESADVLKGCRELALDRMGRALAGMLDRVEDELFELAEKATDREVQNTYLDARSKSREKRTAIEATFRQHFVDCFNRKVEGMPSKPSASQGARELSLVQNEDLEETLAVREMARKLGAACEGELFALSQRMGFLLERPELEDDANPLSPDTICAALKDACDQIEAGFKVRLALLRQFERHAEAELQHVYHDLNTLLVERRILPDVRIGVRRNAPSAPSPARRTEPPAPQARSAAPDPNAAATNGDLFGTLAQLIGASLAGNGPAGAPGTAPAGNVAGTPSSAQWPLAPGAAGAAPAPPSFVAELTRMHREAGPMGAAPADALVNVVRSIKAAPQSASLGTVDAMTIDIVAMLFDYIFDDRHIPTVVKALLGRLQIPMLKVALLDKSFFSSKAHPARRLLDLLAESAIGLDEANAAENTVVAMIEGVVAKVLADFDTDIALFESQVARVEAFIEERKRAETSVVERSARLIEAREREEIARLIAEDEVGRRLESRAGVPYVVRAMLTEAWIRALAAVQAAEGEESAAWRTLLATMDDLLWSIEPKVSPDDRKRLVGMLPGMLKNLGDGLARAAVTDAARDAFLGALVDCHANAVKAGLRGVAALLEVPAPPPRVVEDAAIAKQVVSAGDIQVEEIRLRTPRGKAPVRNVFTRTGIWTNLQRGTWVEFAGASPAMRARLTWISPNKGVYLFTNPLSTAAAVSISPDALAEQMRLGEARMLDDAPLVDRAVDSMLANLRQAAA